MRAAATPGAAAPCLELFVSCSMFFGQIVREQKKLSCWRGEKRILPQRSFAWLHANFMAMCSVWQGHETAGNICGRVKILVLGVHTGLLIQLLRYINERRDQVGKSIRGKMGKNDVIQRLSEETGYVQGDIRAILEAYKDIAVRCLQKGGSGEFKLLDLVKVERVDRKARMARNPRTGEQVEVPARRALKTRPLTALKKIEV